MPKIKLTAPWSYHTTPVTTDYPAGEHEVSQETYDAAVRAGVHKEERINGSRTPKAGPARAADAAEG